MAEEASAAEAAPAVPAGLPAGVPAGISAWSAEALAALGDDARAAFAERLDALGELSGVAQHLNGPITSCAKLAEAPEQTLYLLCAEDGSRVLGFLKVGPKHLYLYVDILALTQTQNTRGKMAEFDPLCVLDFYVHESVQRQGLGRVLFAAMLERQAAEPAQLAYDRPSPKLMPFLQRHYGLARHVEQPNRYVVFDEFFS